MLFKEGMFLYTCTESCNKYITHETSTYMYILYDNFVFLHVYSHCCMCKRIRFSKFWDGYNNNRIVVLDDPTPPAKYDSEEANAFRSILSTGPCAVEIKYGTMQFDSDLMIIISNLEPHMLAGYFGPKATDPINRRFIDTAGCINLNHRAPYITRELNETLLDKLFLGTMNYDWTRKFDFKKVLSNLPPEINNFWNT